MAVWGTIPAEPPVQRSLDLLAPGFRVKLEAALATLTGGPPTWPFETVRSEERQRWLWGFGRSWDDSRGIVTNAASALTSWHAFGLAVDVVEKSSNPWSAPDSFWTSIGEAAEAEGLVWGGRWQHPDRPHVQAGGAVPVSPTNADRALFASGGVSAVWTFYGLDAPTTVLT